MLNTFHKTFLLLFIFTEPSFSSKEGFFEGIWIQPQDRNISPGTEPQTFTPIHMQTGRIITQHKTRPTMDELKSMHKRYIAESMKKLEIAKLDFAFKHHFIVPKWLRPHLPAELTVRVKKINAHNVDINTSTTPDYACARINGILQANRLTGSMTERINSQHSKLATLINEAGFDQKANLLSLSKSFLKLNQLLVNADQVNLSRTELNHISALLLAKGFEYVNAYLTIQNFNQERARVNKGLVDIKTSAAQLAMWSSLRSNQRQHRMLYLVKSLNMFKQAARLVDQNTDIKLRNELREQYATARAIYADLLSRHVPNPRGVLKFIQHSYPCKLKMVHQD